MAYSYTLDDLMRAFGAVESSQDYGEIGPLTRRGNRAYGRYQVMDFNVPNWTERYTGTRMTPEQFLQDPAAQDAVFRGELGRYYNSGQGDPRTRALNAASMWFTGQPYSAATANLDDGYITNDEYLRRIGAQLDAISGNPAVANAMNQPVASRSAAPSPATAPMSPELTALSMGQTNIAPTTGIFGSQQGGRNMVDQTQPQGGFLSGLLSRIGMQRQDPMAGGEAAMPFYQRPQFRDFATNLGLAMGGLATRPNEAAARALEARQVASAEERRASRTVEWLAQQPGGAVFVRMIEAGASPAQAIAAWQQMQQQEAERQQGISQTAAQRNATAAWFRASGRDDLAAAIESGVIDASTAFERMNPEETAAMQTLRARAEAAGLTPGTPEFQQFMASQGGGVSVNVGAQETAFGREAAQRQAQRLGAIADAGVQAQRSAAQLDTLEDALGQAGTGATAPLRLLAGQFGIRTEGLDYLQLADALINQMIPSQRPPGSGTMSDRDVEMFRRSLPNIINQPGGNQLIIDTMRAVTDHDIRAAAIANAALNGQITPAEATTQLMALGDPLASVRPFMAQGEQQPEQAGQLDDVPEAYRPQYQLWGSN